MVLILFNDIYNFLSQFLKKTNKDININLLLQVTEEMKTNLEEISNSILNSLYNYNINEIDENKDLNRLNNEEKENINNLIDNWWLWENTELNNIDNGFNKDFEAKKEKKDHIMIWKVILLENYYDYEENEGKSFPKFDPL